MSPGPDLPAQDPPAKPQHNILISIPRTASNLVTHLLALPSQPSIIAHPRNGYFFLPALSARFKNSTFTRSLSALSPEERKSVESAHHQSASAWESWIADAEQQGRGTYVKEHINWMLRPSLESAVLHPDAPTTAIDAAEREEPHRTTTAPQNPTTIPDALWPRVRTTLLVRHPALVFPSALRAALANEGLAAVLRDDAAAMMRCECAYTWHVLLYRFLSSLGPSHAPLVVDASQLLDGAFAARYAAAVGLDGARVLEAWEPVCGDELAGMHAVERRMKDTLLGSCGVVAAKLSSGEGEVERASWEGEFGGELARRLEGLVGRAMADYEWLFARRWRG